MSVAPDEDEFFYEVQPELLDRFAASTIEQRLDWLDEARSFSWEMTPPALREQRRALRDRRRGL